MSMPFKKIFDKDNSADLLILDLSNEVIRLVHARDSGSQIQIVRAQKEAIALTSEGEISAFVSRFCKPMKSKVRKVILTIPSNVVISKNVDIPSKDPDEIRKIIDLQSGRFTPHSREEIVIDWFAMETPEQHYTNVLLVIMQRKIIERFCAILDYVGLTVHRIVLSSEALSALYDSKSSGMVTNVEASGGIAMGMESSDFTISDNHQMVFIRNIPIGAKQLQADAENSYKLLMDELNKSISAYKDQGFGKPLKNLYLSGLVSDPQFLERSIKEQIPFITLNNVTISTIDQNRIGNLSPEIISEIDKNKDVSFIDLFAAAFFYERLKIDLVPREVKMKHQVREGGKDIVTLGMLIMTLMLVFSIFLVTKIFLKKEQIKRLDKINESSFDHARTLEQTSTKSKVLKKLLKTRGRGLYVFEKVNSMIGEDIYLTAFNFDKDGAVSFSGTAESMSRVFAFVNELEESNYFKDVKTKETKSRREGQKEVADFSIECIMTEVA